MCKNGQERSRLEMNGQQEKAVFLCGLKFEREGNHGFQLVRMGINKQKWVRILENWIKK